MRGNGMKKDSCKKKAIVFFVLAGAFFVGLVGWIWFALAGGPEGTWLYGLHLTIGMCAAILGCLGGGIYCSVKARRK